MKGTASPFTVHWLQLMTVCLIFHSHLAPLWPLSSSCPLERDTYSNGLITRGVHFEAANWQNGGVEKLEVGEKWMCADKMLSCSQSSREEFNSRLLAWLCGLRFLALAACLRGAIFCVPTILRWAKTPQNSAHMLPLSQPSRNSVAQPKHTICPHYRPPSCLWY